MAMVGTGRHSTGRVSPLQMQELLHSWATLDPFFQTPPILSLAVQVKARGARSSIYQLFLIFHYCRPFKLSISFHFTIYYFHYNHISSLVPLIPSGLYS